MNSAYSIVPSLLFLFLPSQSQQASKAGATTVGEAAAAAAAAATKQNMFKFIEVDGNAFISKVSEMCSKVLLFVIVRVFKIDLSSDLVS